MKFELATDSRHISQCLSSYQCRNNPRRESGRKSQFAHNHLVRLCRPRQAVRAARRRASTVTSRAADPVAQAGACHPRYAVQSDGLYHTRAGQLEHVAPKRAAPPSQQCDRGAKRVALANHERGESELCTDHAPHAGEARARIACNALVCYPRWSRATRKCVATAGRA